MAKKAMSIDRIAELDLLCCMINTEPCVRAAMQCVVNSCLHEKIIIREQGKPIKAQLLAQLQLQYKVFFRNAVTCAISVGFVPFVLRRRKDMLVPMCLPLGSFEWTVLNKKPDSTYPSRDIAGLTWYNVQSRLETVQNKDIYVFPFEDPVLYRDNGALSTPMSGLLQRFREMREAVQRSLQRNEWNMSKHVVVTEQVDVKDQTTSGIQLLDEQRRYYLTGHHNQMRHDHLLRLRNQDGHYQRTVTEGIFAHVRSEFEDSDERMPGSGSKRACCHIMPPNVQVQELQPIDENIDEEGMYMRFARDVVTFFQVHSGIPTGSTNSTSTSKNMNMMQGLIESEHRQYVVLCEFLQRLGQYAYSKTFNIDDAAVEFTFQPVPVRDPDNPEVQKMEAEAENERAAVKETEEKTRKLIAETAKTQAEISVTKEQAHKTKAETEKTTAEVGVTNAQVNKTKAETRKTSAEVGVTKEQVHKTRAETVKTTADVVASKTKKNKTS